jgi:hypothetical protein
VKLLRYYCRVQTVWDVGRQGSGDAGRAGDELESGGMQPNGIRFGRIFVGGFLAELVVFAIVFPVLYFFGQRAFLASILIASAAMPFVFAVWVGRHVESRFVLHGGLVGLVAALVYMIVSWGQPQPLLYKIAHGLKVVGGMAGGALASRRKTPVRCV